MYLGFATYSARVVKSNIAGINPCRRTGHGVTASDVVRQEVVVACDGDDLVERRGELVSITRPASHRHLPRVVRILAQLALLERRVNRLNTQRVGKQF